MPANKNICDCPNPPGGQAVCEPHQLAICRVKDGIVQTECINPPDELAGMPPDSLKVLNWAFEIITGGVFADPHSERPLPGNLRILERQRFEDESTGQVTSFRMPQEAFGGTSTQESGAGVFA